MKVVRTLQELYDIAIEINNPGKIVEKFRTLKPTKKVVEEFTYLYFNSKNNTPLKAVKSMLRTIQKKEKKRITKPEKSNKQLELPLYEASNYIIEYYEV